MLQTNPMFLFLLGFVFATCVAPSTFQGQEIDHVQTIRFEPNDEARSRIVPLKVYASESEKPLPVILFSHGLGGSRENNTYLGKHWAAAGYICVFLQHAGSDQEVWKTAQRGQRFAALKAATGGRSLLNRLADVTFVIDLLESWNAEAGHPLQGRLDLERIGMSGHSYGAATTLGVAGRKYPRDRTFPEDRIDAFLPMSPQASKNGYPSEKAFGNLAKPILCMTGTEDGSPIDPSLKPESRREVYAALPVGDKYQLVLEDAQHSAFGDSQGKAHTRDPKHHPAIQQISTNFWDAYLKGESESKAWLQSNKAVKETGLSSADQWMWK
jgi:predicted dienelactone hydrolase